MTDTGESRTTVIETLQEPYVCNSCIESIPAHRARVSCHSCPAHHLCANCHVIKNFIPPHAGSHSTMVFRQSGLVVPLPPGFAPRSAPALPPRNSNPRESPRPEAKMTEMPTANWGALWSVLKAPLEKKDKRGQKASANKQQAEMLQETAEGGETSPITHEDIEDIPPSSPKSVGAGIDSEDTDAAPSHPRPASWEPLFEDDATTPTPIFVALMSTIFSHLDPMHTGFLNPEVYSGFLDAQGTDPSLNTWRTALGKSGGEHDSKEVADLELSLYFTDLAVSHRLHVRTRDPSELPDVDLDAPPRSAAKIRSSMRFSANMPMLDRQGFIAVCAIEYLRDPTGAQARLQAAVDAYGIWPELGPVPREILPAEAAPPRDVREGEKEKDGEGESGEKEEVEEVVEEEEKEEEATGSEMGAGHSPLPPITSLNLKGGEKKIEALLKGNAESEEQHKQQEKEEEEDKGIVSVPAPAPAARESSVEQPDEKSTAVVSLPQSQSQSQIKKEKKEKEEKKASEDDIYEA
ncbi:uncharacterized protein L3040_004647 [Drepanopeziza brunnea f. sp. 'multigermtubi']|uniref:DUF7514 domain-containing protein n=1 Tax=Marssonina brunnea f. sp. multigermtubi (strain MB_m1) TaxID=1072389 RepID=K1Y7A6_MARBU|nr:uncharacterized protein MBM_00142 [Drepanopeziza brunnea f. sp. 'multigermtubi' MB_m1]EKD21029.1 hypothetical protein MBM_00142 [Drepanopeziza brunnea f. sp. 'multigermtubi' MB_m1]KAJ5042089.1 hypothetical protein L3040_004647 [Drepanopeziza brunnea f. sp. 'multigermtubi']